MAICPACNTKYEDHVSFCPRDGTKLEDDKGQEPSRVGQVLADRYRIVKLLGQGGMGEVYVAEHVYINKKVALKLLRPEITSNTEAVERFRREAYATSTIGHENIIVIDDFGKLGDGTVYFTMELLEGEALSDAMLREPLEQTRALGVVIQIARGLAAAHSKGIVHRDMKPENVFLTRDKGGRDLAKILDFGIAKVNAGSDSNLTRTGQVFGTPHYMSPEQAMGKPLDHRADIYSVGVIMYEMFTGQVPFKAESFIGILTKHVTEVAVPPRQAAPDRQVHQDVEAVILKAMEKEPDNRYQTMAEMLEHLDQVQRSVTAFHMAVGPEGEPIPAPPPPDGGQSGWSGVAAARPQSASVPPPDASRPATGPFVPAPPNPATVPPVGADGSGPVAQSVPPPPGSVSQPSIGTPQPAGSSSGSAGMIVGLVVGLVILLGGGGAGAWYFLYGPGKGEDSNDEEVAAQSGGERAEEPDGSPPDGEPERVTMATADAGQETADKEVRLVSSPADATVRVNGAVVGKTPCQVELPEGGDSVEVRVSLRGHRTEILGLSKRSPKVVSIELKPKLGHSRTRPHSSRASDTRPARGRPSRGRTRGSAGRDSLRPARPRDRARPDDRPRPRTRPRHRRPRPRPRPRVNPFDDDKPVTRPRPRPRETPIFID